MAVILALRALGIGDLLTGLPALRALRAAHPDDRLVVAAPASLQPLLKRADCADALHPTSDLAAFEWPGPPPELAVNLHGSGPQSITALAATRPGTLLTHAHPEFPHLAGPAWDPSPHEVDRWCRLLEWAAVPTDRNRLELAVDAPRLGHVIVHPGASAPARRWPLDHFGAVAAHLRERGFTVVLTGSADERPLTDTVAMLAGLPASASRAGDHSIDELVHLVAGARLLVSADTGVGHLATAVSTPLVLLFGPVSPAQWGPPPYLRRHHALWAGLPGDPFADTPDPGLLALTATQVIAAVETQLRET